MTCSLPPLTALTIPFHALSRKFPRALHAAFQTPWMKPSAESMAPLTNPI